MLDENSHKFAAIRHGLGQGYVVFPQLTPEKSGEMVSRDDAKRWAPDFAPLKLQQHPVLGDEKIRAACAREFEEFLIVRVAASRQWRIDCQSRGFDHVRDAAALCQLCGLRGGREDFLAQRISKNAGEFEFARGIDEYLRLRQCNRRLERRNSGVVKHQPVEPDVGVENQPQRQRAYAAARAGRRSATPSASVAEIVVRTICRGCRLSGHRRPRCRVARLSHITTSPTCQRCA